MNNRKKILALDQGEHFGGAEIFFSDLLRRLSNCYDVHLVTERNDRYLHAYRDSGVSFHHLSLPKLRPITPKTFLKYRKTKKEIQQLISEINPDLIISNTVRTHLLCSRAAKKKRLHLIWMAHDRTFPRLLLRHFLKYPDLIIACSEFVKSYYGEKPFRKKGPPVHVLYPYGIDENELEKYSAHPKQDIVGMVGNFIPWKGQALFIRSMRAIRDEYPETRFVIIGNRYEGNPESAQYFEFCKKLIRDEGLEQICHIKSEVTNVFHEISQWKVMVHCSLKPEPLGRVIFEGLSCGAAVIASRFGGPSEIIADNEWGELITPNVENLTFAISRLLSSRALQLHLADSAKAYIKRHFIWHTVISDFRQIIDPLIL